MDGPSLDEELAFYRENLGQWLQESLGKFALIKGQELAGMFDTRKDALVEGIDRWGREPFLVKEVEAHERTLIAPALILGLMPRRDG